MLLQTIPDTTSYMWLGLGVTFLFMGGYLAYIASRWRSLQRENQVLDELENDES